MDQDDSLFEDDWGPASGGASADSDQDDGWDDDGEAHAEGQARDAAGPARGRGDAPAAGGQAGDPTVDALLAMSQLLTVAMEAGPDGEEAEKAAHQAALAVYNAGPPFCLRFVGPAVFRDRSLLPVGTGAAADVAGLMGLMARTGVGEVRFVGPASPDELRSFGHGVHRAATGDVAALRRLATANMRCSPHPAARSGGDPRQLDPEVQTAGLLGDTERLLVRIQTNPGMWPWELGVQAVRQLERAAMIQPAAALRASELDPRPWDPQRTNVSFGLQCLLTLGSLRVSASVRRAATHALLALNSGLEVGVDADPLAAARDLLPRMTRHWSTDGKGEAVPPRLTPHQLRVCAIVQAFAAAEEPGALRGVTRLLYLLLTLAGERLRGGGHRTMLDLLALAAADTTRGYDAPWIAALAAAHRQLPIGSGVQLADGRFAVVLDPGQGQDAWRPIVQAGGAILTPDEPVVPACPQ